MIKLRLASLAMIAALSGWSGVALAEPGDDGNCYGALRLGDSSINPALATVTDAAPRRYFVQSRSSSKACPAAGAACQAKAYLVPKDEIFTSFTHGDFICATKVSPKGRMTSGWLPKDSVAVKAAAPVKPGDWLGEWLSGPEQKVVIKRGRGKDAIAVDAAATFGMHDPERVKRGAVNSGDFKANVKADGPFVEFTVGENGTLPFGDGDEYACRVQMLRLDKYLVLEDNGHCGGMNVSFNGLYARKK